MSGDQIVLGDVDKEIGLGVLLEVVVLSELRNDLGFGS